MNNKYDRKCKSKENNNNLLCSSRKIIAILSHKRDWNFLRDGGWDSYKKNLFHGGDLDIFWNYTLLISTSLIRVSTTTGSNKP